MAYIIPNSGDTGSGQRYANINQAEPDSLDIEALGLRANWIRSGGDISVSTGSTPQVSVAAGVAVISGTPYSFSALSATSITPTSFGTRFDLVIVRATAGVASIVIIAGTESAANPTLPRSRSVLASGYNSSTNVDPATDVLLGSIYVTPANLSSASVVDKRIIDTQPVVRQGTAVPTSNTYDVIGDVVIYNGVVYFKKNSTTWDSMATKAEVATAGFPIGSIFAWPVSPSNPGSSYLECNGQVLATTSYPALAALLGSTYGGNGTTTFGLPNLSDNRTIIGATTGVGSSVGVDSITLDQNNIPMHTHNVAVNSHPAYSHPNPTTSEHAGHTHLTPAHHHEGALMYRRPEVEYYNGRHITYSETVHPAYSYHVDVVDVQDTFELPGSPTGSDPYNTPKTGDAYYVTSYFKFIDSSKNLPVTTAGSHTHTLVISQHPEQPHVVTETGFGATPPIPLYTTPKSIKMRWFIRAL